MEDLVQKANALHDGGFNCAQAVLGAFCGRYGMDDTLAMQVAGSFGGGLRCGEVCGAVTGAAMVIGLKYGQTEAQDKAAKEKCYEVTSAFMKAYADRKGTLLCRELLGYDVRDGEAKARFPGRPKEVCPGAIGAAVRLLEEMGF